MLNLPALRKVLSAVISAPHLHTAILFTPSGELVAHATSNKDDVKDKLRVLVGLSTEIWYESSNDEIGMAESELGKLIILPLYSKEAARSTRRDRSFSRSPSVREPASPEQDPAFLIALIAMDDVEWAEMQMKARSIVNHLTGPLIEFSEQLCTHPSGLRSTPRIAHNFY